MKRFLKPGVSGEPFREGDKLLIFIVTQIGGTAGIQRGRGRCGKENIVMEQGSTSRLLRSISLSEIEIKIASSEPSSSIWSRVSFEPIVRSISRSGRRSFMPIIRRGTVSSVSE